MPYACICKGEYREDGGKTFDCALRRFKARHLKAMGCLNHDLFGIVRLSVVNDRFELAHPIGLILVSLMHGDGLTSPIRTY